MKAATILNANSAGQCSAGFAWVGQQSILVAALTTSLSVTLKKMSEGKVDFNSCKKLSKMPML